MFHRCSEIMLSCFLQDRPNGQNEECCSYTSSNRESWGRCSSLGGSDGESSDFTAVHDGHQVNIFTLLFFYANLAILMQDHGKRVPHIDERFYSPKCHEEYYLY